jgi:histone acetyltransferase (RNA polymerase elongator complex component)
MCSSPKPKRKIKAKTANSGGILASMSSDKRLSFAERANQASDRRLEAQQLKREEEQHRINQLTVKKRPQQSVKTKNHANQSWFYWLLNAPFSELMRKLVS